jgi:hypothetical protein
MAAVRFANAGIRIVQTNINHFTYHQGKGYEN